MSPLIFWITIAALTAAVLFGAWKLIMWASDRVLNDIDRTWR